MAWVFSDSRISPDGGTPSLEVLMRRKAWRSPAAVIVHERCRPIYSWKDKGEAEHGTRIKGGIGGSGCLKLSDFLFFCLNSRKRRGGILQITSCIVSHRCSVLPFWGSLSCVRLPLTAINNSAIAKNPLLFFLSSLQLWESFKLCSRGHRPGNPVPGVG